MKKQILFVDDDLKVLDGFRRALRTMRYQWEISFAESGEKALKILARKPYNVIVSDMHMPGMSGAELLREVMERYPHIVRIILSGHSNQDTVLRTIGPTHQYISKPCPAELLITSIKRVCTIQNLLPDHEIKRLVSKIASIPSHPSRYTEIINVLKSPKPSVKKVGEILSKDIGMSAKILQLINSAYFGLPQHVSGPAEAVIYLGHEIIKKLFLSEQIFTQFQPRTLENLVMASVWEHSLTVGILAKQIAQQQTRDQKTINYSYIGGLLHDIGILILADILPAKYEEVIYLVEKEEIDLCTAEWELIGSCHDKVGAFLLGLWGFPDPIIDAVAFHHTPSESQTRNANSLMAIHLADVIDLQASKLGEAYRFPKPDSTFVDQIGLANELSYWEEVHKEVILKQKYI